MKILMLIDRMESGGAETHVEALADALCADGDRVEVFSAGGRIADRLARRGIAQWKISPVRRSPWRFLLVRRMLKKLVERGDYDILHAHTRTMALLMRGLAGRGKKIGSVVTVHAAFGNFLWLSRLAFRSERVIAVSEDLRKRGIEAFGIPAESISVIPNGIDSNVFCPSQEIVGHQTVLFVSRLDEDCALGAELLCKIAPRLIWKFPDLRISVVGGGNALDRIKALAENVNRECRKMVGRDVIMMLGGVEDMASLYREHRIFVGASRAAMEAAVCGCAVILCGNEGRGGVLTLGRLLTDVDNLCSRGEALPNDAWLERELRFLLENERRTAHLAEIGRAWVQKHRGIGEVARQTRRVYETLCGAEGETV